MASPGIYRRAPAGPYPEEDPGRNPILRPVSPQPESRVNAPMLTRLSLCLHPAGIGRTRRGMSYNPTTQPRSLATGRFLPGPTAAESPVTLGGTQAAQRQSNAYRHLSEGGIHGEDRRRLGRESLQELLASGMLHRMVGTSNVAAVEQIMSASRDLNRFDSALDAVADMERRSPGSVPPGAFGKKLAVQLLSSIRQTRGAA